MQVGKVYKMQETDESVTGIIVTINLHKNINIPKNSVAHISGSLLGNTTLNIELGTETSYAKNGDTLATNSTPGLLAQVKEHLIPAW